VGWGGGGGGMKPVGPKKMISSESIWSSKQYRVLVEMGCRKEDAEFALRSTNGNLEDALELLNMNGRMREPGNMFGQESGNLFDQQRRFPMPGPAVQVHSCRANKQVVCTNKSRVLMWSEHCR
jgi:hypothetical protein